MKKYSEELVNKLLESQVGNCWVAVSNITKDISILEAIKNAHQPGYWREKEIKEKQYIAIT